MSLSIPNKTQNSKKCHKTPSKIHVLSHHKRPLYSTGEMWRARKGKGSVRKIPSLSGPSEFTDKNRRAMRRRALRLHGCIEPLRGRNIVLQIEVDLSNFIRETERPDPPFASPNTIN